METIIFTFLKKAQKIKIVFQQCSCNGSQKAATAEEQGYRAEQSSAYLAG